MLFYNETYKDVYNELVFYNINRLFSTFYNVFDRVLPQKQDKYMICMYSERFVFVVAYNKNDINSFYVQVFCIFYKLMFCDTLRIFCIPLYIEYVHIYIRVLFTNGLHRFIESYIQQRKGHQCGICSCARLVDMGSWCVLRIIIDAHSYMYSTQ